MAELDNNILLPVSRMIGGSLYTPTPRVDDRGQPELNQDGSPKTVFNFGIAIPKAGESHWAQTDWGAKIYAIGSSAYPGQSQSPVFSWKIVDGDSSVPNKKNNVPRDQAGYPDNWVIWLSQSWAPQLCDQHGIEGAFAEKDSIVPGYFVQAYISCLANKPTPGKSHTPGVYLNPKAVAFIAYGERIESGRVDTKAVGFGGALPPGASATPLSTFVPPVAAPVPGQPAPFVPPGQPAPFVPPGQPAPFVPPGQPAPPPNMAFLQVPQASATPQRVMLPLANGASYESMIGVGWTDELMIAQGMMVIQ